MLFLLPRMLYILFLQTPMAPFKPSCDDTTTVKPSLSPPGKESNYMLCIFHHNRIYLMIQYLPVYQILNFLMAGIVSFSYLYFQKLIMAPTSRRCSLNVYGLNEFLFISFQYNRPRSLGISHLVATNRRVQNDPASQRSLNGHQWEVCLDQ